MDVLNNGTDILRDITHCNLSQVSWVIPDGRGLTMQIPNDLSVWVAAVINAIGNNPTCPPRHRMQGQTYWDNTVIVVTWDDWGGWSDNQPAKVLGGLPCKFTTRPTPCPGDYQFGFRVPLLVVSAYTPKGATSTM